MSKRKVKQTKFGGSDADPEEQGDCIQASLSTMLAIPLDQAFDFRDAYTNVGSRYWDLFIVWCKERGWYPICLDIPIPGVLGLVGVESEILLDRDGNPEGHTVVAIGNIVVHDPNELRDSYLADSSPPEYVYLVPIDPAQGTVLQMDVPSNAPRVKLRKDD